MKKKAIIISAFAICLSVLVGGTSAYFTAEEKVHNVITTGGIDIKLSEWADEDKTVKISENCEDLVMPGTELVKIAEVENVGTNPAYIRIKILKNLQMTSDRDGNEELLKLNINTKNWTLKDDGYYYYNEKLEPGRTTEPLFTTVRFSEDMGNEYQNAKLELDVAAYATQVDNNGNTVFDAKGWPAE